MEKEELRRQLEAIVGEDKVQSHPSELVVYECDALIFHRRPPDFVVYPSTARQIQEIVRLAYANDVPYLPRGAGTSLSGGAVPISGGILIQLSHLNRILEVNARERYAVVEPGVINLELSEQVKPQGLYFAPDPSSQSTCTVGGNIGANAGGPHCLKYGTTVLHVLAAEVVTPEGDLVQLGSPQGENAGFDLTGLFTGSEGTLGILTKAWVRLLPLPEQVKTFLADFTSMADATRAVSGIIARGIIPAAMEIIDQLTIQAVEDSHYAAGYPTDAAAVLLVELDGLGCEIEDTEGLIDRILRNNGAREVLVARDEAQRAKLWAGRKKAYGAFGRLARNFYLQDTVVPRTRLTEVLEKIYAIADKYDFSVINVFHAGDGNLHPMLPYDASDPQDVDRVLKAAEEMVRASIEAGGSLSGEHGVGLEKRDLMPYLFTDDDLEVMRGIRQLFDPKQLCNPEKILPTTKVCMEFREKGAFML